MSLINFILDVAGLLLWLSWRSIRFDPLRRATPATLVGTVRRAEPSRLRRWHFLAGLLGLLFLRALFYSPIGTAVGWTPRLDLGAVVLAFPLALRGHDFFLSALLFSVLSFVRVWIIFHFWLLALVFIHGPATRPDPFLKMIQLQLGGMARWPRAAQALAPGVFTALLWIAVHPLLAFAGVVNRAQSVAPLLEQGAVVGAVVYLTLKHLLPVFLFLHLVTSYVYLGTSPLWDFIGLTARKILVPLERLPLRLGRVDFTPLVGIILLLLLLHALPLVLQSQLSRRNLTLWPQ
jgi:uncharacterized protein YggT (Ycf19 family)